MLQLEAFESPIGPLTFVERIAVGGFSIVEKCIKPNGDLVAVKKERALSRVVRPVLEHEYKAYKVLAGHPSVARVEGYCKRESFYIMVMELLGPSLGDRFREGNMFSLQKTAQLGLSMLEAIEYVHSKGLIHRDVKPDNFLCGKPGGPKSETLHITDFGLSRRYRDPKTGVPFPLGTGILMGTLTYASLNAHLEQAQSRRDDLQSLSYILIQFVRGSLPWEDLTDGTELHVKRRTQEKKRTWTAARLTSGYPTELRLFVDHCLSLGFSEEPDYAFLRRQLVKLTNFSEFKSPHQTITSRPEPCTTFPGNGLERGRLVFARVLYSESLEYDCNPKVVDLSYFHRTDDQGEDSPYRIAVVRDATYSGDTVHLSLLPVSQRMNGLTGIAPERARAFQQLPQMPSQMGQLYVYKTGVTPGRCHAQIPSPFTIFRHKLDLDVLAGIEVALESVPIAYTTAYDSDDADTRSTLSRTLRTWWSSDFVMDILPFDAENDADTHGHPVVPGGILGWTHELTAVETKRREENGDLSDDDDESETMSEMMWDGPSPENARLSCQI